ncbi:hypothetical protein [Sinorhizobium meliloti]|uniref:hypothetical protein n=1 Tax=Rhizobium meliloti TaxID=382 RepID=UPI001430D8D0|nr:hypothetical protein [Sinorhizobium meliloti]
MFALAFEPVVVTTPSNNADRTVRDWERMVSAAALNSFELPGEVTLEHGVDVLGRVCHRPVILSAAGGLVARRVIGW